LEVAGRRKWFGYGRTLQCAKQRRNDAQWHRFSRHARRNGISHGAEWQQRSRDIGRHCRRYELRFKIRTLNMKISRAVVIGLGSLMVTTFLGCASSAPTARVALARAAVDDAVAAGAPDLAPGELQTALGKLEKMNAAMQTRRYETALTLAEEVELDARVAETKARSAKAELAANKREQDTDTLHPETQTK
jgi:hypothetical protein